MQIFQIWQKNEMLRFGEEMDATYFIFYFRALITKTLWDLSTKSKQGV